ncbi:hypothetical protein BS78_08G130500 [Paspalum vaginatum]|nr:hypothetical protein BS78_08G130500 [Paspalum vaginatum]
MPKQVKVWRPVSSAALVPPTSAAPAPATSMAAHFGDTGGRQGRGQRRRRARRRRSAGSNAGRAPPSPSRHNNADEEDSGEALLSSDDDHPVSDDSQPQKPRCIIDRSDTIARCEEALGRALVVSVVTEHQADMAGTIAATVARRFELEEALLTLHRFGPASFLLIPPSEEAAARIYNGGRPIIEATFRLHVMFWSRFMQSSAAASLPFAVEVELRGIPAHAWEFSTAEKLLDEFCWVSDSHPDTANRRDVYRVAAWCSCPERIPAEMELDIIEPQVAGGEGQRRTLTYPIEISVLPFVQPPRDGRSGTTSSSN